MTATDEFRTLLRRHEGTSHSLAVVMHTLPTPLGGTVTSVGDEVATIHTPQGYITFRLEHVMIVGEQDDSRIAAPQTKLSLA